MPLLIKTTASATTLAAFWYAPHPRLCTLAPNVVAQILMTMRHSLGFADQHFVLPRGAADDVMRMVTRLQQCNGTWPYQSLEQWLLDTLEASARGLGTHLARTRFPFAIVRNGSREPSARDFCQTPVCLQSLKPLRVNKLPFQWTAR